MNASRELPEVARTQGKTQLPLARANQRFLEGRWNEALHALAEAWGSSPNVRWHVAGNVELLLRAAPLETLDADVLHRLTSAVRSDATASHYQPLLQQESDKGHPAARASAPESKLWLALRDGLGIEKVYVVNLDRRPDRLVRELRELNRQGVPVVRVPAIDASCSSDVQRLHQEFLSRSASDKRASSAHLSDELMARYRSTLPPAVFAYLLSQRLALEDARRHHYRRVLVLDDDIFFATDAARRVEALAASLSADWKILLLGASEYADRGSARFRDAQLAATAGLYHPLPGETCGSFAVAYDACVYETVIAAIDEADGTFDNVALGSIYLNERDYCFAVEPAICIPDVGDSDIRPNSRSQETHSQKMNWEFTRYSEFTAPFTISILIEDFDCIQHIDRLQPRLPSNVLLNVYYLSQDGLRPVIPGRRFAPVDSRPLSLGINDAAELRAHAERIRVPFSDAVLLWPRSRLLDTRALASAVARAQLSFNANAPKDAHVDGVICCLELGVRPQPGLHSIVIPSFRPAENVWPTVLSALTQDSPNVEVIVVNDNPEDADFSTEIIRRFEEHKASRGIRNLAKLTILDHTVNRNAAAARNTGFLRASGQFLHFLDDDDLFEADRTSAVEPVLSTSPSRIGGCYCGYSGTWNGGHDLSRFPEGNLGDKVLRLRYGEHYMCTNTVSFLRDAFAQLGGFNEAYRRHQDLELMTRFFLYHDIAAVPRFCVRNRPNPAPETFIADIPKLCRLKHQFLQDFSAEICDRGTEFAQAVIDAHSTDISKRDKNIPASSLVIIESFLRAAIDPGLRRN